MVYLFEDANFTTAVYDPDETVIGEHPVDS